jgi:hypothetical protein
MKEFPSYPMLIHSPIEAVALRVKCVVCNDVSGSAPRLMLFTHRLPRFAVHVLVEAPILPVKNGGEGLEFLPRPRMAALGEDMVDGYAFLEKVVKDLLPSLFCFFQRSGFSLRKSVFFV